jgi:hypothetical protein
MSNPIGARKTLLKITQYVVNDDGTITQKPSSQFTVLLNPAEFSEGYSISYDPTTRLGQSAANPRFAAVKPQSVNFSIVLDGTGVVPTEGSLTSVKQQLKNLNDVIYTYVGSRHEPSHVQLVWGSWIFNGRLESLAVQYTLFKPNGDPLRAKVTLGFTSAVSDKEAELKANRQSPDLSHRVLVRDGDTLPLLCERIYGDPAYYIDVARFNGLVDFRRLEPGTRLHFPPLE